MSFLLFYCDAVANLYGNTVIIAACTATSPNDVITKAARPLAK